MTLAIDSGRALFHEIEQRLPESYRVEYVEGETIVTPPADGDHEDILARITRLFITRSALPVDVSGGRGVATKDGNFIPDLTVVPQGALAGKPSWAGPEDVLLTVEVTSSKRDTDRNAKRQAYARAGIPLYLLVDRNRQEIILFSEPSSSDYAGGHRVPFGKSLELPTPFNFLLEDII